MDNGTKVAVGIIVAAFLVIGFFFGQSNNWFQGDKEEEQPAKEKEAATTSVIVVEKPVTPEAAPQENPPVTNAEAVPIEDLRADAKNKFTLATITVGNLSFYTPGADVSDPNIQHIDYIDLSAASPSTTRIRLLTNTPYDVYYSDKGGTNYDDKITDYKVVLNPETGKGTLLSGGKAYHAVSPAGAQVDVDTLPEVQSSGSIVNDTGTDTVKYVEANGGGSFWIKVDIGNTNSNTELRSEVACIRDNDGDMDGNEITALTASYVSGSTSISIPGSLIVYWQGAMGGGGAQCFKIADVLGSSQQARWQFSFTVDEAQWDTDEEFELSFDDVGGYLQKQYPSRNAKAAAESLTLANA